MTADQADEVMAEYLLKGGKMLAKSCKVCGYPLFEYKGETQCVICRVSLQKSLFPSQSPLHRPRNPDGPRHRHHEKCRARPPPRSSGRSSTSANGSERIRGPTSA